MSAPDELAAALMPFIRALDRVRVRHLVGGSVASAAHGEFRATNDIDVLAELRDEHVAPLTEALRGEYYASEPAIRDAVRRRATFTVVPRATMRNLDVCVSGGSPFDASSLGRAVARPLIPGRATPTMRLATPEDVVLAKLRWYRAGGEVSERQWRDVLGVLRIQADRLDIEYLRTWSDTLGVRDLAERALAEAADARE